MEYTEREIKQIRERLIDYYGSATPFFSIASADVIRVEQMSDEKVIEEAKHLRLI